MQKYIVVFASLTLNMMNKETHRQLLMIIIGLSFVLFFYLFYVFKKQINI